MFSLLIKDLVEKLKTAPETRMVLFMRASDTCDQRRCCSSTGGESRALPFCSEISHLPVNMACPARTRGLWVIMKAKSDGTPMTGCIEATVLRDTDVRSSPWNLSKKRLFLFNTRSHDIFLGQCLMEKATNARAFLKRIFGQQPCCTVEIHRPLAPDL